MRNLAAFFVDNYKFTYIVTLFFIMFGFLGFQQLNSESFPSVDFATVTVSTRYPGATPRDIETKITKPIEDEIRKVSGLKDVRSISQAGRSTITVRIDMDNEDVDEVMADLRRAVDGVNDLPLDLLEEPEFKELNSEEFPAIELAVRGPREDRKLDRMADHLKEELEDNRRVLDVRLINFHEREFQINLDVQKMQELHIGTDEVLAKVGARNVNVPGGDLKDTELKKLVRIEGKVTSAEELENVVIRSNFSGQRVLLKDVAKVEDGGKEVEKKASFNGESAILMVVNKKAGADTIALVSEVEAVLERFRATYGDEYKISIYNNEAQKVKNRLEILNSNALTGLVLVVLFLLIFLPGRVGVMASFSLPIAVMATVGLMPGFGMNLNAITILALVIALGMLVDNSVVISENFSRLRREGVPLRQAVLDSVADIWLPITITALTTISAFLPMLVTKGIMGEFIKWIPIVVTISLIFSLLESFFLLPTRLMWAGKNIEPTRANESSDWFEPYIARFEKFMATAVHHRYIAALGFAGVLIGSLVLMVVGNKFMLFPPDQTEVYLVRLETERGTRLEETERKIEIFSGRIKEALGDRAAHIVARAGGSQMGPGDQKGKDGDNIGLVSIYVDEDTKFNVAHTEVLKQLRAVPGQDLFARVEVEAMINGPPVGDPINATFRSNDSEQLEEMISEINATLAGTPGVIDLQVDDVQGAEEVFIEIDHDRADQLGLNTQRLGETVRTALTGTVVSNVVLNNKEVDLLVRVLPKYREKVADLNEIRVMDAKGNLIPITRVARYVEHEGSKEIRRFDFKRARTLLGNVEPEKITSVEANGIVRKKYDELSKKYPEVSLVFGGEEQNTAESMQSLQSALVLAIIGIFALLVFLFQSYLRPLIIMSTIPLGLVGFSISFFLHGRPISFLAMIGVIGLAGIIVNSGIVLISFIDRMREDSNLSLDEILRRASGMRLRAVLVTSLTTVGGLMPTAYGIGGSEAMLIPMTLAMAWGLTSGTILTLVWVPCAYAISEDITTALGNFLGKRGGAA